MKLYKCDYPEEFFFKSLVYVIQFNGFNIDEILEETGHTIIKERGEFLFCIKNGILEIDKGDYIVSKDKKDWYLYSPINFQLNFSEVKNNLNL